MSCHAVAAPEVISRPPSPEITRTSSGRSRMSGCRRRKLFSDTQWTVASWPSSSPVSAARFAPVQAAQIVAPPSYISRSQRTSFG